MAHPEWALKFKEKGTELRCIRGKYYLYRVSSVWDKEKKRARKISGEMIGTITENDGLTLKGIKKKTSAVKIDPLRPVSTKEYGASSILASKSSDIISKLQESFPLQWRELWTLAVNRLLYQAPLKNMQYLYQESCLSEENPDLNLSKNNLTDLLQSIGEDRMPITDFMSKFIDGSQHLVFDTSHVTSNSNGVKMSEVGYNSKSDFTPQVNLFYVFSTDKETPVYYRLFPGNISGISALELCMKEAKITKAITVGDKGFYSRKNIDDLAKAGISYILPLKRDNSYISYERLKSRDYDQAFEGHFFYKGRAIFYYCISQEEMETNQTNHKDNTSTKNSANKKKNNEHNVPDAKIVVFYDKHLSLEEDNAYLKRIGDKLEGYSMEGYKEKQFSFGTMSMITNIKEHDPQKIYESYKSRMEVETVFDTYKNLLEADRTYMHSDKGMQAWMFINHLSLLMYYKIFKDLKDAEMLGAVSPADILMRLSRISKLKIGNTWLLSEINSKTSKMLHKLNYHIT
jgi:transposase